MARIITLILLLSGFFSGISSAQSYDEGKTKNSSDFQWPDGKKIALSLTFDDARLTQIDKGIPLLDNYGVKATFYVSPNSMKQRLDGWKKAVANGHDIGNHSMVHPCSGNFLWARQRALEDYTIKKMRKELDSANLIIKNLLGVEPVSFGYPCGQKYVGRGKKTRSYIPLISKMFESGRGWLDEAPNDPSYCDMAKLYGMELDGKSFEDVLKLIETAKAQGGWLILAGHEMNHSGHQTSQLSTIEALCKYAMDPANGIWIDNVHNIASYVNSVRSGNSRE